MTSSTEAWRDSAGCRRVPTEEMYPNEQNHAAWRELKIMCSFCPVQKECLEFADSIENSYKGTHGMYGGLTPSERVARRRDRLEFEARRKACATPGRRRSVERHYRLDQPLCEACARWEQRRVDDERRWDIARDAIRAGHNDHQVCWIAGVHKMTARRLRAAMQTASISS